MTEVVSVACQRLARETFFEPVGSSALLPGAVPFIGLRDKPHAHSAGNPFRLIEQAARGEIGAQRALAEAAAWTVLSDGSVDPMVTISEGLMFARMAAAHGNSDDEMRVISMLSLASVLCNGEAAYAAAGEAIARLEILWEDGAEIGDLASDILATTAESEDRQTMLFAQDFRTQILAARN